MPRRITATRVLGWGAGLVLLALSLGFAAFLLSIPGPAPLGTRTDGVVVLTGDNGRLERGLDVLRSGAAERMLVSGVPDVVTRLELAATVPGSQPLFDCCVDLGQRATDTRSNAEETADWARAHGLRSIRLVTSDYHLPRARFELAAELGPGVRLLADPAPAPRDPPPGQYLREYVKLIVRLGARTLGAAG